MIVTGKNIEPLVEKRRLISILRPNVVRRKGARRGSEQGAER